MKTEYHVGSLVMTKAEYRRNRIGILVSSVIFEATLFLIWWFFGS